MNFDDELKNETIMFDVETLQLVELVHLSRNSHCGLTLGKL